MTAKSSKVFGSQSYVLIPSSCSAGGRVKGPGSTRNAERDGKGREPGSQSVLPSRGSRLHEDNWLREKPGQPGAGMGSRDPTGVGESCADRAAAGSTHLKG